MNVKFLPITLFSPSSLFFSRQAVASGSRLRPTPAGVRRAFPALIVSFPTPASFRTAAAVTSAGRTTASTPEMAAQAAAPVARASQSVTSSVNVIVRRE